MTEFEAASLAVARSQWLAYVVADFIAALALIAAVAGGVFAYSNVKILRLSALVTLEQDLARRRSGFQSIALTAADAPSEMLQKKFEEAKENYFNGLDRLCWGILRRYLPGSMKQDYHEQLTAVIRAYPNDFNAATPFKNIVKLHKRWDG